MNHHHVRPLCEHRSAGPVRERAGHVLVEIEGWVHYMGPLLDAIEAIGPEFEAHHLPRQHGPATLPGRPHYLRMNCGLGLAMYWDELMGNG